MAKRVKAARPVKAWESISPKTREAFPAMAWVIVAYSPTKQRACVYAIHTRSSKTLALKSASHARWLSEYKAAPVLIVDPRHYRVVRKSHAPKPAKRRGRGK